jgi:hypothetical protein
MFCYFSGICNSMTFFSNVTTYAPLAATSCKPAIVFSRLSARSSGAAQLDQADFYGFICHNRFVFDELNIKILLPNAIPKLSAPISH